MRESGDRCRRQLNHDIPCLAFAEMAEVCVMKGSVGDVAKQFPANVNLVATVSLTGIGPDRTQIESWADLTLRVNSHRVTICSDRSGFIASTKSIPSLENLATGRITSQKVSAILKRRTATLRIGT